MKGDDLEQPHRDLHLVETHLSKINSSKKQCKSGLTLITQGKRYQWFKFSHHISHNISRSKCKLCSCRSIQALGS